MFKTIEIKINGKKIIIDECDYKTYPDVMEEIKLFINECLTITKEKNMKKEIKEFEDICSVAPMSEVRRRLNSILEDNQQELFEKINEWHIKNGYDNGTWVEAKEHIKQLLKKR